MKLHLDLCPPRAPLSISHSHKLLLAGSCFAENIGEMLQQRYFSCLTNPGGILFDALSVARFLRDAASGDSFYPDHLVERGGQCFSYLYHSSVSAASPGELLLLHEEIIAKTRNAIRSANFIVVTLGTAFTYYHRKSGMAVANCHKQPGSFFDCSMADPRRIIEAFNETLPAIRQVNNNVHIIFSVSPVKYLKYGPVQNNLSKGALLLAVNDLVRSHDNCSYFPAYELVTDDLRDYRFFKEDLVHPNELAIKYVWQKFSETWFSDQTRKVLAEVDALNRALSHRSIHHNPEEEARLGDYVRRQKSLIMSLEPAIRL